MSITLLASMYSPANAGPRAAIRFRPPVTAIANCVRGCYEPTVTSDAKGRVFVTVGPGGSIGVSRDGGASFRTVPTPDVPVGGEPLGDAIVQIDPHGRLVYSILVGTGIQFAVSSDAGRSWDWNGFVGVPGATAPLADRQWIAFGLGNEVYAFWRTGGFVYWTATSHDGGRTFGPPEPFLPGSVIFSIGQPITDASAAVYVPVILGVDGATVAVAVSKSGAGFGSFVLQPVSQDAQAAYFPIGAVEAGGRLSVAWYRNDGSDSAARVSSSSDGGRSWFKTKAYGGSHPAIVSPWITLRRGRQDVMWFEILEPGRYSRLMIGRSRFGRSAVEQAVVAPRVSAVSGNEANTDFAHFALLPDGRVVTVWSDTTVSVAVEAPFR